MKKQNKKIEPLDLGEYKKGLESRYPNLFANITEMSNNDIIKEEIFRRTKENMLKEIEQVKQHIKSACEFYWKYKDDPGLFVKECPKYKKKMKQQIFGRESEWLFFDSFVNWTYDEDNMKYLPDYNEWLFKLAFKEVLKGR